MKSLLVRSIIFTTVLLLLQIGANAAGVIDRAFGTNGTITMSVTDASFLDALFTQDGKFVAVLHMNGNIKLIRYFDNGSLDPTFGSGGIATLQISSSQIYAATLQSNGKIVLAGSLYNGTEEDFFVMRVNTNGAIDNSFGVSGMATANQGVQDNAYAVAVQSDGKIVVAGYTVISGRFAKIFRLNVNGTLDTGFAVGGFFSVDIGVDPANSGFQDLKILPNGRILASRGIANIVPGPSFVGFHLIMLDAQGSIYLGFGHNGQYTGGTITNPSLSTISLQLLPSGKIFVAFGPRIAVLNANGIGGNFLPFEGSHSDMSPDGRILANGYANGTGMTRLYSETSIIGMTNLSGKPYFQQNGKILLFETASGSGVLTITRLNLITSQGTRLADFDRDDKTDFAYIRQGTRQFFASFSGGRTISKVNTNLNPKIVPELIEYPNQLPPPSSASPRRDLLVIATRGLNIMPGGGVFPARYQVTSYGGTAFASFNWGLPDDIPVGGDFNGDGQVDLTMFRPSDGIWYSARSDNGNPRYFQWGTVGDKPVPADYDYDGITDYAIYRPSTGSWWVHRSSDNGTFVFRWGVSSDIPLTGDFDGDGHADFTVFRPSEGIWYQYLTSEGFRGYRWGISTDVPVPGDYDGDGRHDVAVFRDGIWYLLQSSDGFRAIQFGSTGDTPVSVRYDE